MCLSIVKPMQSMGYISTIILDQVEACNNNSIYCIFVNNMFSCVDWIYTNIESLYIYDYKIVYLRVLNNIYNDNLDFFFTSLWYISLSTSGLQFFWSVLLDNYVANSLLQFSLTDEWVRSYITSKDASLLIVYHPEIVFFKNQILDNFLLNHLADINVSIIQFLEREKLITPIMLVPQLVFLTLMIFLFASFFFSFYVTPSDDEASIDADYLSASVTVEAEKEIGSLDDILMPAIILIYTFGWYFYLHCWNLFSYLPELTLVLFFFPLLYYTILNTPVFLLYDFGIFFICYLRGIAPTQTLVFELLYDYIAVIAFYVRVLTQGVRLALMFFAYASMHDYIMYMHFYSAFSWGNESIWESIANINVSVSSITYFILVVLPFHMFYWLYEVIHTFFVVTGQLIAFFSMVFWLFLFLFTFFVIEKQENYFEERRKFRQKLYQSLDQLKSSRETKDKS